MSQMWNWKIHNMSVFGRTLLQRVNFWIKMFTTCPTLKWSLCSVSDFELKIIQNVRFRKKCVTKLQVLIMITYNASDFEMKFLKLFRLWNENSYNVSDSKFKTLQRVGVWMRVFTTMHKLNKTVQSFITSLLNIVRKSDRFCSLRAVSKA